MKNQTYQYFVKLIISIFVVFAIAGPLYAGETKLAIGTGNTGGGYYPMGGTIANLISENIPGVTCSAQVTGASLENVKLIQKGKVALGLASAGIAYSYKDKLLHKASFPGVSSIMLAGSADVVAVTIKNSINSIMDLKGKKVGIGSPGSATEIINKLCLSAYGLYDMKTGKLGIKPAYLSYSEMAAGLKDGRLDAAMYVPSGMPNPAIMDVATFRDIKIISLGDKKDKINELFPFLGKTFSKSSVYKGVDYDVETVKGGDIFMCSSDLPEDLVYNITKLIVENLPELSKTGFVGFKKWSLDRSVEGLFPLHPGAKKYYDEVGIK